MPPKPEAKAAGQYKVAHGRTITTDAGHKQPGDTVQLTDEEAKRLRDLGFILAEDGTQVIDIGGPAVHVEDGVQIKPA